MEAGRRLQVSREWVFRRGENIFTLYDWKATSLYDPTLLSPDEFWLIREIMELHVGSKHPATPRDAEEFGDFVIKAVKRAAA
jgi:hypothetical protein